MKKTTLLFSFVLLAIFSSAQVNLQAIVKPGAKLIYAVEANEQRYEFIVTVKALTPAVVFDWQMTDPVNTNGTITHTATAMVTGNTMYNYFSSGAKTLDDNTLSVWLSKNAFISLTKGGKNTMIKMNTNEQLKKMGVTQEDPGERGILVDGEKETVEEFMARELNESGTATGGDVYFSFSTSAKVPIIISMRNGFTITLKEIKTK